MCEHNDKENKPDDVSKDTVYGEFYTEMRRYRDYQLNVATWYTAILLAILSGVLAMKFGSTQSALFQLLSANWIVKVLIAGFATLIGISGIYSILYSSWRHDELRKYVDNHLEPNWKEFKPKKRRVTPRGFLLLTEALLVIAIDIVVLC